MRRWPSITIITGTLNSNLSIFAKALLSIKAQQYPKSCIKHIVMDGGSTNGCADLAKQFGCKVVVRDDNPDDEQMRPALAIQMAKSDLILILESDNILTSQDWLSKMVEPFKENKKVFFTFSAYNHYEKDSSITTKYCALFGSPDPTIYYLNKTEKIRMDQTQYNKGDILKETRDYYIVQFNRNNLPTLGDNGHMFLTSAIKKVVKDPATYLHTDAIRKLLDLGYDTFGVAKNSVIHVQNPNLINLVKRRIEVKRKFYDKKRGKRKYLVFDWHSSKDQISLIKYIVLSFTFIIPLFESIRGYTKIKDRSWFLHPIICLMMVIGYAISEIRWLLEKLYLGTGEYRLHHQSTQQD